MNNEKIILRINSLCEERKISINQMSQETGLSKSVVDNIKKGSTPSVEKISIIADYFNVSIDFLLGKTEIKTPVTDESDELNEYLEELKTRPEMRMLFSLAKGATKEDVEKAVAIIEALRKTENG